MGKIKIILGALILLVSGQVSAAIIPSDIAFSIDGLSDIAPITYQVSTSHPPQPSDFVTVERGFTVAYGSSFDITARLTNTGSSLITFVESNPPTAIDPTVADIILSGEYTQQIPENSYFGGPVLTHAHLFDPGYIGPFGLGNGDTFSLLPGESISYIFGNINTANIIPTADLELVSWGVTRIGLSGAYLNDSNILTGLGRTFSEPFAIQFSPVPIPATIWLFGTGLIGLIGFCKHRKAV